MSTYQRDHITVDENFARFGSKSYAINKITSVDVRLEEVKKSAWVVFAIISALFLMAGLGSLATGFQPSSFVIAAVSGAIAFALYQSRLTRTYHLLLATASGEVQATKSPDPDAIAELRDAIERQIIAHGKSAAA